MDLQQKIDIVVLWVDGADPAWQQEKAQFDSRQHSSVPTDDRIQRYRDFDLMRYWFRGMEQNLDWIGTIYFVTWGHIPDWLDTNHPQLQIINHKDIIPAEYLPVFNSNAIEIFIKNIPNLSEQFLLFNDDMFLMQKTTPTQFFQRGLPKDMLAFQPIVANESDDTMPYVFLNNAMVLAKHFRKREGVKRHPGHYFHIGYPPLYFFYNLMELAFPRYTGFYTVHGPSPLLKSVIEEVWNKEPEVLECTARQRFRSRKDVSQYLFREWAKLTGRFVPYNICKDLGYYNLGEHDAHLYSAIRHRKHLCICINDSNDDIDFNQSKEALHAAFQQAFPVTSSFEKSHT